MRILWDLISLPFRAAAWVLGTILSLTGRFAAFLIGLALCAGGAALCASIIGLTAGVPMVVFGGGLMIRSIF